MMKPVIDKVVGGVLLAGFLAGMVGYGGGKTNSVPQNMNAPFAPMGEVHPLQGLARLIWPEAFEPMILSQHLQMADAEKMAANWNVRGAWRDSFKLDFDEGWVFPWGTNHLTSVEVLSHGEIRPLWNDTNAVARLGVPVSIVPGLTNFSFELTPSNSYRFAWTDAVIGRAPRNTQPDDLLTASLELFRCGDVAVTTNGVTRTIPRELPFAHDGFGQDAEWVAANFTSATEIAAAGGYPAWVDAQVGEGLTNGLYKFTVTMSDDPPETTLLSVGDLSVAVTNAGEYVFLLEKGVEYEYGTIPFLTNVVYSAVDDIPAVQLQPRLLSATGDGAGGWTVDGGCENQEPTAAAPGRVAWWPLLYGSPDVSHIGPDDSHVTFEAVLSDYCASGAVSYQWAASDGLAVASPNAQTTEVTVQQMPSWAEAYLSVTATLGSKTLYSYADRLTYGTNTTPQVHLSLDVPTVLIVRDEWMDGSVSATATVAFRADAATNGELRVWLACGADKAETSVALPMAVAIDGETDFSQGFALDGITVSDVEGDVEVRCAFMDVGGQTNATASAATTILSPTIVSVPSAPDTGLAVVKGASVGVSLAIAPQISGGVLTQWQTAKRKTRTLYDPWTLRAVGAPHATLTMGESGVFALRAVAIAGGGCQSNAVEYVHAESESALPLLKETLEGPCLSGERNHIGVASTQGLLVLRNSALMHLNSQEYGKYMNLASRNGFAAVGKDKWKCNAFVADVSMAAGFNVPALHIVEHPWPLEASRYPPAANEWANGTVPIAGWIYLGSNVYPEPGFVAGHPSTDGSGHCGIVDYDGWTISARRYGVSRKALKMLDGTCGYNKPEEYNYENTDD